MNWKEFATAALDKNNKVFVMHVISLAVYTKMTIHPSRTAQIALLITDKASIIGFAEYSNFADVFLLKSTAELPEYSGINDHLIELIDDW